jgi:ubiquinone/menaquinone biosynthesis C-methylase UbiE
MNVSLCLGKEQDKIEEELLQNMRTLTDHYKENENKWDRRAGTYDNKRFNYFRYMQKKAINRMSVKDHMTFLDLGCGTGWAVRFVSKLVNENGKFIGIDISGGMIEKAIINARRFKNVSFLKASAEELPFERESFDSILCTNSFHHYLHPDIVMAEIFRVLKTHGRIYILDVTSDDRFISWINSLVKKKEKAHVSFYRTSEYKNMFLKSGLKHIESKKINYPLKLHIAEK